MKADALKVKCVAPQFKLGDVKYNGKIIVEEVKKADKEGVDILVFPELCLCGYSLRDMLSSSVIVDACEKEIQEIEKNTEKTKVNFYVGMPLKHRGKLYNSVVSVKEGRIESVITKKTFDKNSPFGENRVFYTQKSDFIKKIGERRIPVGAWIKHITDENGKTVKLGCCIGNDYSSINFLKKAKTDVIINPTAQIVTVTMEEDRERTAKDISYRANCTLAMCNAGEYESTTDGLFAPHSIICQKGEIIGKTKLFNSKTADLVCEFNPKIEKMGVKPEPKEKAKNSPHPFILDDEKEMDKRCELILNIQSHALARRLEASYSKTMVVGISGGLDSTLVLLAMVKSADYLGWDRKNIIAVTMPCFGTTQRTKSNAIDLCKELGVTLREINIFEATKIHLRDIGHDENIKNVAYENAQARERTQILMDISNDNCGIVVGTGDLSESALGWATYNGDHMSMYNVNSDIPKTLVRHVVNYFARNCHKSVAKILLDILDTPVSPELLPAKENGEIEQKTEDLVGPYDLHDYFLYNFVGREYAPSKIYALAKEAFCGKFDEETVYKWLKVFIKRFVTQQFKRSASPEGVKIGSVSLSPRGDFNMPSDMSYQTFLDELESNR